MLDPRSGKSIALLEGHSGGVNCARFWPNSAVIATGSDDGTIRLWDQRKAGSPAWRTLRGHVGWVKNTEPVDARHLLSASFDGTLRLWDITAEDGMPQVRGEKSRGPMSQRAACAAPLMEGASVRM